MKSLTTTVLAGIIEICLLLTNVGAAGIEVAWQETNNFTTIQLDQLNTPIIKVHSGGNIYVAAVAGRLEGIHILYDYVVVKRDGNGQLIWQTQLPTSEQASLKALALDEAGNAHATGSGGTAKFSAAGEVMWAIPFGDREGGWKDYQDIGVDSAGNVYVTGLSLLDPSSLSSVAITTIKYDANGQWLWKRQYLDGVAYSHLRVDESDNVYVVGDVRSPFSSDNAWAIIKYDGNGNEIWTRRYNTPAFDQVHDALLDKAGNLIITGNDGGNVTLKYDPDGNLLWEAHQPVVGLTSTIALDHSGNVYVRGWQGGEETSFHSLLKLDAHGRHQWIVQLTSDFGWGRAFAVDKKGNAYLGVDLSVLKFDPRGNQTLTIPIPHEASTMAVDRAGHLLVSTPFETTKFTAR